jgi:hypothetical protein
MTQKLIKTRQGFFPKFYVEKKSQKIASFPKPKNPIFFKKKPEKIGFFPKKSEKIEIFLTSNPPFQNLANVSVHKLF